MSSDIIFFRKIFKIVSFLGITPLFFKKHTALQVYLSFSYSISLEIIYIILIKMATDYKAEHLSGSALDWIIVILEGIFELAVVTSHLFIPIRRRRNWRWFFQLMEKFDRRNGFSPSSSRIRIYHAAVFTEHVLLVVARIGWCLISFKGLLFSIFFYDKLNLVTFHFIALDLLVHRYDCQRWLLEFAVNNSRDLGNFFIQYGVLRDMVDQLDAIFGWTVFSIHIKSCTVVLHGVHYLFNITAPNNMEGLTFFLFLNFTYIIGNMVRFDQV